MEHCHRQVSPTYRRFAAGAVIALLALTSCSVTTGSGKPASESRTVTGFTRVDLSGDGDVAIEQSGTESLTIEADDNVLPKLTSTVSGATLMLGTKPNITLVHKTPIKYRLTVKNLTGLTVSGSGTMTATNISTSALNVDISGSGTVTTSGTAESQTVTISGSGGYVATGLASKSVTADISGSGDATVAASDSLHVDLTGSGSLTYSGEPQITQDISGSGRLVKK